MKRVSGAGALLLLSVLAISAQTGVWFDYKSTGGRFSISMPKQPTETQQETKAKTGETLWQYMAMTTDGDAAFLVGYMDLNAKMTFSFDEAISSMSQGLNAAAGKARSISLGGSPGREVELNGKLEDGQPFIDFVRIYQTSQRVYVLQHLIPADQKGPTETTKTNKFFDSFSMDTPK